MQFREKVINKMFAPDDTDSLPRVTTPVGWISLLTVFVLLSALLVWAFLGQISMTISGNGLLMSAGGITRINAPLNGVMQKWQVKDGEAVTAGQQIAAVYSQELELQITRIKNELNNAAQNTTQYIQAQNELAALTNKMNTVATITSPVDGTVVMIAKNIKEAVREGETLAYISSGNKKDNLHAVTFVSGAAAKRLKVNMPVRIELGNVRADKYGYLMGRIGNVSSYPVNELNVAETVGNDSLAKWLIGSGQQIQPIFSVDIELIPDALTKSGYVWSTTNGAPEQLSPGTPLAAACVVEQRRPIELVFDWLKKFLGGD
ncbi:MAG: HlyD family efflux transporter periplasmic adaptor subunit [Negativicutes bacterium]|jgi:biotin carboxyl carrier protein